MNDVARELLTGNAAAAWAARAAEVDYVPAFPITPQTEIIETLARWARRGEIRTRLVTMDSEHSMLAAAGTASASGVRVFTATSSQGLVFGFEMLYAIAGLRAPLVLVNVSRALSHPITLEPDHNDALSARDTGFLQIHTETCQEVFDSVLMAYRLAEDARVLLPALVNLDGFYLSFTREPVELPAPEAVKEFLPPYEPSQARLGGAQPVVLGATVLDPTHYSFFKYQMHRAAENALCVHEEAAEEFARLFGRRYGLVEECLLDDAEYVIVMTNSFASMGKAEVRRLRREGKKVGLLRLRMLRPFPHQEIQRVLAGRKGVAVVDQNLSVGKGGVLFSEVASAVLGLDGKRPVVRSFVGGLGGRRFRPVEFDLMYQRLVEGPKDAAEACRPELLFSEREFRDMERLAALAGRGEAGA